MGSLRYIESHECDSELFYSPNELSRLDMPTIASRNIFIGARFDLPTVMVMKTKSLLGYCVLSTVIIDVSNETNAFLFRVKESKLRAE